MINQDKWISSLRKTNIKFDEKIIQVDHHRWENTIPKKDTFNTVKKNSFNTVKKYSFNTVKKILPNNNFICLRVIICICCKK